MSVTLDRAEENLIESHLDWDNRIKADDIDVHADDGHVILRGTVSTYLERHFAEDIVWQLPGVRSVVNQITVNFPKHFDLPTDLQLENNIKRTLNWHPAFDSNQIDIEVRDGHVSLMGTVETYWHKLSMEEQIANIIGVVRISNQLAVVPTQDPADEATAKDIVEALQRTQQVDMDTIDVTVESGYVTLAGSVPTAEAYRQAQNAAIYTFGVIDVENNLIIT